MDQQTAYLPHHATLSGVCKRQGIIKRIALAFAMRRSRNDLARLTDTQLQDIGLTRDHVEAELNRPIWDVPASWRQR